MSITERATMFQFEISPALLGADFEQGGLATPRPLPNERKILVISLRRVSVGCATRADRARSEGQNGLVWVVRCRSDK